LAAEGRELPAVLESMGMAVLRMESLPDTLRPEQREMAGEFGRAAWLAARQNSEESFRVYEQLEAKHRGKPNVAYAFGAALVAEKERERAISFFNQELDRDPRHVAAMLQIAFEELAAGNFEEALASGRRALAVSPNNSAACYVTGRAFLYLDNPRQAVLMLEKAGKLAPDSARIFYTLWQAYQRAGRSVEAARARAEFDRLARLELQKKGELVSADSQYGEPRPEK
jgi:tetratricopeptide (TPR) repeat protein